MGLYLSTPVTEKHTHYEECNEFKFASSEMQGLTTI